MAVAPREVILWAATLAALVGVIVALVHAPRLGIGLAGAVALACIAVIARISLARVGAGLIAAFAFTASWDLVEIAGVNVRLVLLLLGTAVLAVVQATERLPPIPWWVHCFGLAAIAVTSLQVLFPISSVYLDSRYLDSELGVALGSRPGVLFALSYLLLNVYLVPIGVVLAAMAVPRVLRWIIIAFVGGVAMSSLAAYLGFVGYPWLADLLAPPFPVGVRAVGYTSHPLHLATSGVMALGLAVWVAVQRKSMTAWFGRAAVLAIVLGLYSSGSRGGIASGVFVLALCAVLIPSVRRRGHVVVAALATAVGLVILFAPAFAANVLRTTRIVGETDVSDLGRRQVFEQALSDFVHSPVFGIGTRFIAEAHVLYVGVLAGGGVILFLGYVLFNIGSLRAAHQARAVDGPLAGALLATLIGSLAYWTVGNEFAVATVQIVYGILIAALVVHPPRAGMRPVSGESADEPAVLPH